MCGRNLMKRLLLAPICAGVLGLLASCTKAEEPTPAVADPPPDFNFIPINDPGSVCSDAAMAKAPIEELLSGGQTSIAEVFEVCSDRMQSTCGACSNEDNPL